MINVKLAVQCKLDFLVEGTAALSLALASIREYGKGWVGGRITCCRVQHPDCRVQHPIQGE